MTSKKKGGGRKTTKQLSEDVDRLSAVIEEMQASIASLTKSVTTQAKHIKSLQSENKRITHKLNRLQLGPQQSSPALTDGECADDTEEKESVPSSSSPKAKGKTKAKKGRQRISRRALQRGNNNNNSAEPTEINGVPKIKSLSWQSNHKVFSVGDNGSTAIKPKFKGGSIRFGRFLTHDKDHIKQMRVTFTLRMIGIPSSMAFGFATEQFGDYNTSNFGNNYSCIVKGNGQYFASKQFSNDEYEHKAIIPCVANAKESGNTEGFFKEGDRVIAEINFEDKVCCIWNASVKEESKKFTVTFTQKRNGVAIIAYMAGSQKKKCMVDNTEFIY